MAWMHKVLFHESIVKLMGRSTTIAVIYFEYTSRFPLFNGKLFYLLGLLHSSQNLRFVFSKLCLLSLCDSANVLANTLHRLRSWCKL